MAEVFNIKDFTKQGTKDPKFLYSIHVYEDIDGVRGIVDTEAAGVAMDQLDLSEVVNHLGSLMWLLNKTLAQVPGKEEDEFLGIVTVRHSSSVTLRIDDAKVQTLEQAEWLCRRFDEAKELIFQSDEAQV